MIARFRHRCWRGALVGLLVGGLHEAHAQEAVAPSVVSDADLWLRLLSSGGLPAVLGLLGYWLPRAADGLVRSAAAAVAAEFRDGITVRIAVPEDGIALRLSPDQLDELGRLVLERERARGRSGVA